MQVLYADRTQHYHVRRQFAHGPILTTQLYFPEESRNSIDFLFRRDLLLKIPVLCLMALPHIGVQTPLLLRGILLALFVAGFNPVILIPVIVLSFLALVMLAHRLLWPVLDRSIYPCSVTNFRGRCPAMPQLGRS
jgi:hypothetical protein